MKKSRLQIRTTDRTMVIWLNLAHMTFADDGKQSRKIHLTPHLSIIIVIRICYFLLVNSF